MAPHSRSRKQYYICGTVTHKGVFPRLTTSSPRNSPLSPMQLDWTGYSLSLHLRVKLAQLSCIQGHRCHCPSITTLPPFPVPFASMLPAPPLPPPPSWHTCALCGALSSAYAALLDRLRQYSRTGGWKPQQLGTGQQLGSGQPATGLLAAAAPVSTQHLGRVAGPCHCAAPPRAARLDCGLVHAACARHGTAQHAATPVAIAMLPLKL